MSWFKNCYRQGFRNIGNVEALADFDARKLVTYWKNLGAELVYMDAIVQTCTLFPTAKSEISPHLKGRDLVKEFADACRDLGIRSGAYITIFEHHPFSKDHPEWCQTRTDGSMHDLWNGLTNYWSCWNSPFLDKMCALITELFSRYPLDAAFYDGLLSRHGVCHCPSCAVKFKADTGDELPSSHDLSNPVFREYMKWKDATLTAACKRLVAATRVRNPGVQVVSNTPAAWCNWCAVQPVEFFDATEFACCEVFPGFMDLKRGGYIHASSVGTMAYSIAYTRGQSKGYPKVQSYNYAGNINFNTDVDTMLEAKSTIAMGSVLCFAGYRDAMKPAFEYIKRCEPYLVDNKPLPWLAIAASQESCNTQHDPNSFGESFFEDLIGSFHLMLDNKLPVEFVSGRDMGEGALAPYSTLILSDVGYLTEKQIAAIREFVSNGGGLVVTHKTGLTGIDGKPLPDFALANIMGVHTAPDPKWEGVGGYMQEASNARLCFDGVKPWWDDAVQKNIGPEYDKVVSGKYALGGSSEYIMTSSWQAVSADKSAKVHALIRSNAIPELHPLPGIVENRFGKGRVIYIATRLGEAYARYPYPIWRRLMKKAIDRVSARPSPVDVKGPLCVTAYCWEQSDNNRWIIHLLNDLDQTGRTRGRMGTGKNDMYGSQPREGAVPVGSIELIIRKPGAVKAELPLDGIELPVRKLKDGRIKVRIRKMDQHVMIVVY